MTQDRHDLIRRVMAAGLLLLLICFSVLGFARTTKDCVWPASGKKTSKDGGMTVDWSYAERGYIMVKAPQSKKKMKVRVKHGSEQYTYDINGSGNFEVFPLQMGSGGYEILLYENKSGKQYAQKGKVSINVKLSNTNAAFLCPSQYVWYTSSSPAVAKSFEICQGLDSDQAKLDAIRTYMKSNLRYDYIRAATQKDAYLADIDGTFKKKSGLCQDLAAVMTCMLRVQGIPCKLAIGEVSGSTGTVAHAWCYAIIDGQEVRVDITAEISGARNSKYTVEKIY